jgi:hypothetical protein
MKKIVKKMMKDDLQGDVDQWLYLVNASREETGACGCVIESR